MLYHSSLTPDIQVLTPRVSTHGKPYVYATDNMVTSLLFGAPHDDFDFRISTDDDGKPIIAECYPKALEMIYRGKGCSVYELPEDGFKRGMTGWDAELVNESAVSVLRETIIPDILERLLAEERQGNLEICRYGDELEREIMDHVTDRLVRFKVNVQRFIERDPRFERYTPAVRAAIEGTRYGDK